MDGEGLGFPRGGGSTGRHRADEGHGLSHSVEEDIWASPLEREFLVGGGVTSEFGKLKHEVPSDEVQGLVLVVGSIPLDGQGAVPSGNLHNKLDLLLHLGG